MACCGEQSKQHKHTERFEHYPTDLMEFVQRYNDDEHNDRKLNLPCLKTLRGQAVALMAQPDVCGKTRLNRTDVEDFFQEIGQSVLVLFRDLCCCECC